MSQQVPYCIQILQALSTPAIALLAVVIGFFQWRTSHQRAVLDLFDKRFALFMRLREVISEVARDGTVSDDTEKRFLRARDGDTFLFPPKITSYLDDIYRALVEHHYAEDKMAHPTSEAARLKAVEDRTRQHDRIVNFLSEFPKRIACYLRMHQKAPARLWWGSS